ncbi:MAG: cellulase family glycosylhydrolase [Bacteroidetes bacterium]|nr:cellulase family glycosylhydrolase [Bacteroidota bacterium]MBU1116362.1 cellulase family glycosylhydrolase [Bacteroidota bacterium]MBU1800386.1 cellulase family glycosylhydrolase [Bacteroidota bacterium]
MKKIIIILFLIAITISAQNHFNKGVNLTSWFQVDSPQQIQFTKYTKQDFINIKSLGCDVIRLPINLHSMTDGTTEHNLDPLFLSFLDEVVDWAEELNINIILDNHSFNPAVNTDGSIIQTLIPVWKNMAEHFKNRSNNIYFEILNEPHGISDANWNAIQQAIIMVIRQIDAIHTIVVGPANWNSYSSLDDMPIYTDKNLIYTFHFYDPFLFTHQGASWTEPSLVPLAGMPFPYNVNAMPTFPAELNGTWIQSSYNNYINDGTVAKVKELIDIAVKFKNDRNVEIFCGEFGVYIPNSNNEDRVLWYEIVRKYFEEKNISWTIWDYQGGFGLFEKDSEEMFNYDLNTPLINALGFNDIPQTEYIKTQESSPFLIYSDYVENGITNSSYNANATLNFYSTSSPYSGKYCIEWKSPKQYDFIGFDFIPNKDLSLFANIGSNIYLSLMVKGDTPNSKFHIRFVDSKTDIPEDHPWRMKFTIEDNESTKWDNQWHKLKIPLSMFSEQGSWDNNQWYNPIGAFDWSDVDNFQIVAEVQDLSGRLFEFDNIEFVDITTGIKADDVPTEYKLSQNYPNPFNPSTTIKYSIPRSTEYHSVQHTSLKVFDILGREVATLVNKHQKAGNYEIIFNAASLSSGVYFYRLQSGSFVESKKLILIK